MRSPVQGLGRGYAPGPTKIPVAACARFDFRSGVLDLAAAAEIPPEYLLYGAAAGVGAGLLWKTGKWIASATEALDCRGLDMLGAQPVTPRVAQQSDHPFNLIGAQRLPPR